MSIKIRMYSFLMIASIVILFFGIREYIKSSKISNEMAQLKELSNFAVKISSVVHETQKERGRTAGFIASNGRNFTMELNSQRASTDTQIDELKRFINQANSQKWDSDLEKTNYDKTMVQSAFKELNADFISKTKEQNFQLFK